MIAEFLAIPVLFRTAALIALGAWLGRRLFKQRSRSVWGAVLGFGCGVAWFAAGHTGAAATPKYTQLIFHVPDGFVHESVILLADPSSANEVVWTEQSDRKGARRCELNVPSSGVLRVRSLDTIYGHTHEVRLSTGQPAWGDSHALLAGKAVVVFDFVEFGKEKKSHPDPVLDGPEAFAAYVAEREAGKP